MIIFRTLAVAIMLLMGLAGAAAQASPSVSVVEKAALQVAMQQHIERQLIDGAYLHLDLQTGAVQALHPVTAHPMILQMGAYFVLCSDFRDQKGESVNVDFYLARRGQSFIVFHTAVADRSALVHLMKQGRVARVD